MSKPEYAAWLAEAIPDYAADKVESGQWTEDASLELSRKEYDELLPKGIETEGNHFHTIVDTNSAPVGVLWFAVKTKFNAKVAYVLDVRVAPEHRRQGHARRAFLALEDKVAELGLSGIALHVFGHNASARAMYEKLGYEPTNISLFKSVAPRS